MKKLLILIIAFTTALGVNTRAQDTWGTKTLYTAPIAKLTPAPAGYKPVFINHVGRHGARHLTKEVNTSFAYITLFKANAAHALTAKGQEALQMVAALDKVEHGNVKSISAEGVAELQGIGQRMYSNYANVFATTANLNVTETKEIRTKQSADAFIAGLKKNLGKEPVITEAVDDVNLRFYDLSPVYKKFEDDGEWKANRQAIATEVHLQAVNYAIAQRLFVPEFVKTFDADAQDKLASDLFGFAAITYSLKQEIRQAGLPATATDFTSLFSPQEVTALSKLDLADDYYAKGPGLNTNGIQVRIAAPLLANFITTADAFVNGGSTNAQLRFAHAETISPFATLLGISTTDVATKTTNIGAVWQAAKVIPLSANIQWIFYKNAVGSYLVKILLNEQEARITGLKTNTYPYYRWADVRQLYTQKLQTLNVKLTDDMKVYLQNVK